MSSYNKITLIGNLGADPEVRSIDNNRKVTSFSLATNKSYTNSRGEKVEKTEWFRISAWNKLADVAENYLKKGSLVYVEGELSTNEYTDKEGNPRFSLEVMVRDLTLLPNGRDNESQSNSSHPQATNSASPKSNKDDKRFEKPAQQAAQQPMAKELTGNNKDDIDDLPF